MRLLTIAALLTTAATLQACTHAEHAHSEAIFTALGAPLPAGLAEEPEADAPIVEQVVAPVVEEPAEPPFDPLACVTIFRIQTCDEGVLHHLDSNMNWID